MAVIGPMKYLTIGSDTYEIDTTPPIASTSRLGGIKVGTGLSIDASTGILSATGTSITIDTALSTTSTNPVQNKVITTALNSKGTVNSVRVQATSPVQSSVNTAQSSSLDTTISLANGYGDTKNPYGTKTANYVLAGPTSGSAAAPTFRSLVPSDIPDMSGTYLPLTGGTVSGATIFSNSVSIENLTAGDTIVNGSASFTNGLTTSGLIASDGTEDHEFIGTTTAVSGIEYTNGTAASFTRGTFSQGTLPSLTFAINGSDSGQLDISWSAGTLPTHAADSFTSNTPTNISTVYTREGYWCSASSPSVG